MDSKELEHRFAVHECGPEKVRLMTAVRDSCLQLSYELNEWVPEGREKSLALTNLEQAMFWANSAIARQ